MSEFKAYWDEIINDGSDSLSSGSLVKSFNAEIPESLGSDVFSSSLVKDPNGQVGNARSKIEHLNEDYAELLMGSGNISVTGSQIDQTVQIETTHSTSRQSITFRNTSYSQGILIITK
jgi:hypothetical protein